MPHPTYTTRIRSLRDLAPGVRELTLSPPEEPLHFKAGQWLSLNLPIGERPPLVRAYSLAAPPSPSGELELCFDLVPDGLGSGYLFSLGEGDAVTYAGPLGNFVLPEEPGELLWIARYTGIVPFRAMLLELERSRGPEARGQVTLVYSAPRPADLAYHPELLRAAEELPWFELVALVDQPDDDWSGQVMPALEFLPDLVAEKGHLTPMVCGIREFVRPVRDFFYGLGYDRKAVRWENYD